MQISQRIIKLQARQSYLLVTQDSDTWRRPSAVQWHSYTLTLSSVALVASTEDGEETRPSLIEADGHQSSRRCENQSWRSLGTQEDRLQLQHPSDCLHTSFLISPSFLSSRLRCSTLVSFFFLAGFTNGLVTMEIAARETLTYSGWGQKFESFCGGIHSSSSAFQSYYAH